MILKKKFSITFFLIHSITLGLRPTLMGTKHLYENGPNPFFLFGNKNMVKPTLMGTKNLYENGPNPFFLFGTLS